jgi:hypothetical protein
MVRDFQFLEEPEMKLANYVPMCKALAENVKFDGVSPVPSPDGSPFDAAKMRAVVQARQGLLPATYRSSYAAPLIQTLPDVVSQLEQIQQQMLAQGASEKDALAEVKSDADTLVGAVRDWGEKLYHAPLTRFEAVVSNLYRSFLSDEQRASIALPLIETVPPLVTFATNPDQGPFTMPANAVQQFTGSFVGVVSLPASYSDAPLLWPALAHETGGHDVLHADPGLVEELASGVKKLAGVPRTLGAIWASWMDETASDVYGILNIGPSFAISLAAFFSALENAHHPEKLGTIRTFLPVAQGQLLDPHPVDLLRLFVALGVVETLEGLSVAQRQDWNAAILGIAEVAGGGAQTIDVVDVEKKQVVQQLPLGTMADVARRVGGFIASGKFKALQGHSIQEIETWDSSDEQAASEIAAIGATKSIVGLGDDAQLLAGTTLAFLNDPTQYKAITANLNAALDDSFERDPIFGTATPHSSLTTHRKRRALSRTPASPLFPIEVG